ncbi:MAG: hypothetical protein KDD33_07695 [Bdellovibrionales bacterium]|nr:hypothetical protein [Bdellovibrionales bacterium]
MSYWKSTLFIALVSIFTVQCSSTQESHEVENFARYEDYYKKDEAVSSDIDVAESTQMDYGDDDYDKPAASATDEQVAFIDNEISKDDQADNFDHVEEKLPVEKNWKPKKPASVAFKNGMHRTTRNCNMRAKASANSKKEGLVKAGKKLWMEAHNEGWVKVYKKAGPVYLSKDCL